VNIYVRNGSTELPHFRGSAILGFIVQLKIAIGL
jgi:hypothetical protein